MMAPSRRRWLALAGGFLAQGFPEALDAAPALPLSSRFKGEDRFNALVARAKEEGWAALPIGERVARFGKAMRSTPYVGYTLEIDDHIEAPSVNFQGLDCWSFFEISLGMARMIARPQEAYTPDDLLREILFTRYRGGVCTGNYLQRIHYLEEWFFDNEARGVVRDVTRDHGHAQPILNRKCQEMTILWKSYRYLRQNPDLRPKMARLEQAISQLPVHCVPKDKVHLIEKHLQNGDVLGIATRHQGAFCSHVGLGLRTNDGVYRIMHASSQQDYKRVIVDTSLSTYLKKFSSHLGVIVARPREIGETVSSPEIYRTNLEKLTGGRAPLDARIL
jgi:hypothetical protein